MARKTLRGIIAQERYGEALMLLLAFYLLGESGDWISRLADLTFILILLLITAHPSVPRSLRYTAFSASIVSGVLTLTRAYQSSPVTVSLDALSTLLVVVITIFAIIRRLVEHDEVRASTVMGAFLAYALVGFGSAFLYIAVDEMTGQSFFAEGPQTQGAFVYFSLVTLTTVGYGDLTAGTPLAQRLVVIEALAGQVFLVVLVARLVSLWKPPLRFMKGSED